jgi:chromate reductase
MGTAMAQQHLRNILTFLGIPTLGQPEAYIHVTDDLFDEDGNIGAESRQFMQDWMDAYVAWVKRHAT